MHHSTIYFTYIYEGFFSVARNEFHKNIRVFFLQEAVSSTLFSQLFFGADFDKYGTQASNHPFPFFPYFFVLLDLISRQASFF